MQLKSIPTRGDTYFTVRLAPGKGVPAAKQYFRDAAPEVTSHETVDDRIKSTVCVTQEQAVRQDVGYPVVS